MGSPVKLVHSIVLVGDRLSVERLEHLAGFSFVSEFDKPVSNRHVLVLVSDELHVLDVDRVQFGEVALDVLLVHPSFDVPDPERPALLVLVLD